MTKQYRRCVGMMILNTKNEILVGCRLDHPSGYWQMPQGGIDKNEIPEEAVWREIRRNMLRAIFQAGYLSRLSTNGNGS